MRKILTPAEIEAGNYKESTKKKYLIYYRNSQRQEGYLQDVYRIRDRLIELATQGLTMRQMAKELGITYSQVKCRINYWKINEVDARSGNGYTRSKTRPLNGLKVESDQVVEKEKKVAQIAGKSVKRKEKVVESKQRDYTIKKEHQLGYMRMSFYMPFDATEEEVELERQRRLLKYKKSA